MRGRTVFPFTAIVGQESIKLAGLRGRIRVHHARADDFEPTHAPKIVICNPPYGERLEVRAAVACAEEAEVADPPSGKILAHRLR